MVHSAQRHRSGGSLDLARARPFQRSTLGGVESRGEFIGRVAGARGVDAPARSPPTLRCPTPARAFRPGDSVPRIARRMLGRSPQPARASVRGSPRPRVGRSRHRRDNLLGVVDGKLRADPSAPFMELSGSVKLRWPCTVVPRWAFATTPPGRWHRPRSSSPGSNCSPLWCATDAAGRMRLAFSPLGLLASVCARVLRASASNAAFASRMRRRSRSSSQLVAARFCPVAGIFRRIVRLAQQTLHLPQALLFEPL